MPLQDLIAEYISRGMSPEEAAKAIVAELGLLPGLAKTPRRRPPSPVQVLAQVADALPQPPIQPPVGATFLFVSPGGALVNRGWRPPGITPWGFHRGYFISDSGGKLTLHRSGQAVNEWLYSSAEGPAKARNEAVEFVKRWPIQAEKSVIPGRRY